MSERVLQVAVEQQYFDAMLSGEKTEEYREANQYWTRRLEGKEFDKVVVTWGYPSKTDKKRRIEMPFTGIEKKPILHPHFGYDPIEVYAIKIAPREHWTHDPALTQRKAESSGTGDKNV